MGRDVAQRDLQESVVSGQLTLGAMERFFREVEIDSLSRCRSYDTWGAFDAQGKLLGQLIEHLDDVRAIQRRVIRVEVGCEDHAREQR